VTAPEIDFPVSQTALLTTHFGDIAWVELLVARMRAVFPELPDGQIWVIDQDRTSTSGQLLRDRLGDVNVLGFPLSPEHVRTTGHDHANVLNQAVRSIDAGYLLIFDSDAHPVSAAVRPFLARLIEEYDAVLAALDRAGERTHPCFLLLGPAVDRGRLYFDEHLFDAYVDTGRLIYSQIGAMGLRSALLRPTPAFEGLWGTTYADGMIYHHGSGSFASSSDTSLRAQAAAFRREHRFFRRLVFAGRYELSPVDRRLFPLLILPRRLRAVASRVRTRVLRVLGHEGASP